jgi:RNA polymerase sigma-70 factor (ECF subfamily)
LERASLVLKSSQLVEHVTAMRRYALVLTRDSEAAEELVQDALLRAIASAASFRRGADARVWLFSILHNARIDSVRRGRTRARLSEALTLDEAPARESPFDRVHLTQVLEAVDRLPEGQRQAISLVAIEDFSYVEAAGIMGTPVGTLMSRLARGREALRLMMSGEPERRRANLRVVGSGGEP